MVDGSRLMAQGSWPRQKGHRVHQPGPKSPRPFLLGHEPWALSKPWTVRQASSIKHQALWQYGQWVVGIIRGSFYCVGTGPEHLVSAFVVLGRNFLGFTNFSIENEESQILWDENKSSGWRKWIIWTRLNSKSPGWRRSFPWLEKMNHLAEESGLPGLRYLGFTYPGWSPSKCLRFIGDCRDRCYTSPSSEKQVSSISCQSLRAQFLTACCLLVAAWCLTPACCLLLDAWRLLAACCVMLEHLPDPSTKGSTKRGRPKAASLCKHHAQATSKHQASSNKHQAPSNIKLGSQTLTRN